MGQVARFGVQNASFIHPSESDVGKVATSPQPLFCLFTFEFYCLLN